MLRFMAMEREDESEWFEDCRASALASNTRVPSSLRHHLSPLAVLKSSSTFRSGARWVFLNLSKSSASRKYVCISPLPLVSTGGRCSRE